MTRLFLRFYCGVLVVLFLAWYIHAKFSEHWAAEDKIRVVTTVHSGGARLVANRLNAARSPEERGEILEEIKQLFGYEIMIRDRDDLPVRVRKQLDRSDVAYDDPSDSVLTTLADPDEVVQLGRFPPAHKKGIEDTMAGWMQIARNQLRSVDPSNRTEVLDQLNKRFDIRVQIVSLSGLPEGIQEQLVTREDHCALYRFGPGQVYAGIQLTPGKEIVQVGPLPGFEPNEQMIATATLALVLLPAAGAIALLLRPVASQLRAVEKTAETIAAGDLSARVDESQMNSAKPLAQAFNHMAGRTESIVRTQRELLQAVSHELRTPLARMRFAIDLIGTSKTDEEREKRLESLDAATEELDGLVGELLSYVRMESAKPLLEPEIISLRESIAALVPKFAAIHPSVEIDGTNHINGEVVFADRRGFQRAMGNLVSNAGRHANNRVQIQSSTFNGSTIIDVDDDGAGISKEHRERVFEPFVRLDEAVEKGFGVGLGLALVKRIVTQNGGTVEILDSPLGGCRIRTHWPRRA